MICTEVGELMQRQLDYDLNEQELTLLMNHLTECDACKDLFEKLTLLSGSLEQLPRVTPSVSIVDSILPELDAIDRQRVTAQSKHKRYARMRWITTAASVAAAASVVFIMSLGWNGSRSDNSVAYDVAISSSSDTRVAQPFDVSNLFRDNEAMMERANDIQTESTGAYTIEPLSTPSGITHNTDTSATEGNASGQSSVKTNTPPLASDSNASDASDQSRNEFDEGSKQGGFVKKDMEKPEQEMLGIAAVTENEADMEEPSTGMLGIANETSELAKNYSPDEEVYVVIEGHTIALYETSSNEQLRTWEMSITGTAQFVGWDSESQSFIYEVTDVEGQTNSYTINLNEQNE
ncbi:anti-sigma factor family protein [Paenibacillus camelliae]|uniref:anti-sigma factor family protein n=1 Tax=Paenibacillus camelliae TaxID=512410 RepID=UPI00203A89CC|nr:zf-HC2 domain-containing protein [Paenibacillus camelliae]MCM3635474.1 zf-HC2 domain-containing protein [Paenibacillus camelliae]